MSSQQENLKKNSVQNIKLQTSNSKSNLKSSSNKKKKNLKQNQSKKLESKAPSSKQPSRVKNTLAGDRFIPVRYINDNNDIKYLMLQTKNKDLISPNDEINLGSTNNLNNNRNTNANTNNNNNEVTNNQGEEGSIFDNDTESQSTVTRVQNIYYNNMVMDSLLLRLHDENPNLNNIKNNGKNFNKPSLNIENDPRVLTFTSKSRGGNVQNNTINYINKMKSLGEKNEFLGKNNKHLTERTISKTPERILDAPNLVDDYYLNLLDWSRSNVVAVGLAECIYIWNGNNQKSDLLMSAQDNICSVNWMSVNSSCLAIGMKDGTTEVWDAVKSTLVRKFTGHSDRISSLSWNNQVLSTGSKDSKIINHDMRATTDIVNTLIGHTHEVCKLKWSANGQYLASGGNDNKLCIWDISVTNSAINYNRNSNNVVLNYNSNMNNSSSFNLINPFNQRSANTNRQMNDFSNFNRILNPGAVGNNRIINHNLIGNPNIPIDDMPISYPNNNQSNFNNYVNTNTSSNLNNELIDQTPNNNFSNQNNNFNSSNNASNRINNLNLLNQTSSSQIFPREQSTNVNDFINHSISNNNLILRNNNLLIPNNNNNSINLTNQFFSIAENNTEFSSSDYSFSPNIIQNQPRIINPISPRFVFTDHEAAVKALDWCPWQRNVLASGAGTRDKTIKFWDIDSGRNLNSINTGSQVCNIIFNENEKELISSHGFSKNQISIWKYPNMNKVIELDGHMSRVLYMAMSPDGSTIVSGAGDETLRFWKISENKKKENSNIEDSNSKFSSNILNSFQMR